MERPHDGRRFTTDAPGLLSSQGRTKHPQLLHQSTPEVECTHSNSERKVGSSKTGPDDSTTLDESRSSAHSTDCLERRISRPLSFSGSVWRKHREDDLVLELNGGYENSGFREPPPQSYHTFDRRKKKLLVYLVSLGAVFSPLSSNIYFPAIATIAEASSHEVLKTSTSLVALTVTIYMVFQGLAPSFWGPLADKYGRRPIFVSTFIVYLAANIGLAFSPNFASLMVFRAIQATGSAATIALGAGVIGDIATTKERGGLNGIFSGIRMFGQAFGPVLGGALGQFLGFRSIFWFLFIFAVIVLFIIVLLLPETLPRIAGDGSVPVSGIYRPLIDVIKNGRRRETTGSKTPPTKFSLRTLTESFELLFEKDVFITLLFGSIIYAVWSMVTSSTSTLFKKEYKLNDVMIGLVFLPNGLGCVAGSFATGFLMDRDYKRYAAAYRREHSLPDNVELEQRTFPDFPLEKSRLCHTWWLVGLFCSATAVYGWSVEWNIAIPLTLQFIIAFTATSVFNVNSTLMIDLYPSKPASATAINNLMRCSLGALGVGTIDQLDSAVKDGTTFTILSAIALLGSGLVSLQWCFGQRWRYQRMLRLDAQLAR
ncbi:MFS general substrate transporter [Aulographum hederae CBS 113979]|uniref:MFS general substrate transporter n=1 Tax=Aulographum hederae CBS 113979 TaxID=1176131 RepID=A0A6G1H4E2_9PEZI|nr:MFS general substrate transporter [Aulographum hederae CBS 113979]